MSRANVQCHCRKCCALHAASSDSKVEEVQLVNGHVAQPGVTCKVAVTAVTTDEQVGSLHVSVLLSVCECVCELVNEGKCCTKTVLIRKTTM